jgi:valyl-tRNA synthetase
MSEFSPEALPNRFDFAQAQPRIYAAWEAGRYFHAEPHDEREPFSIVIPPPNVTGALHLGHALNNTLQDIQIRMKRMQGYNVCWMPGTDHAGIATQAVVEKRIREEEGLTRHQLGREKLVARIWQWKEQYEARILSQLKQMGCSCDWDRTRFTLDEGCSRAVRQTFFDLFSMGLIYRGKRLVNWDTFLQTAVSDDEVFQETVKGKFWHFRYPVIDPKPGEPTHVEIATTRPETMLGDTAVAVHPEPAKALDKAEAELRERLAKAAAKEKKDLEQQIENIQKRRTEMLPLLITLRDMAKAGRKVLLPLVNRQIPLICDEWAKPELGTGCVKITPAHDPNDYAVWQRNPSIGIINILNPDGTLNENAGNYKGMTIAKARQRVVDDLDGHGLLGDVEDRDIELPHSDRSKTPIEPYLADQWFVKMSDPVGMAVGRASEPRPGLAQMAMDAVTSGRVKIIPERYAKSYLDWLGEKRDWPVSRQLWWGHRIPIWAKPFHGMEHRDEVEKSIKALLPEGVDETVDYYLQWDPDTIEGHAFFCLNCDDSGLIAKIEALGFARDPDVLDTWFSSALWPHSTFGWPDQTPELDYFYPTSVLITSRDIITLWVARMVLTGLNNTRPDKSRPLAPDNMGQVPFRQVFIHPKILDGYGETMSKSKGNGVDPIDIIDKFGADSLRYGLAALTTETQDVRMPVQFECPHCQTLIEQTKKNRELPRIACTKCRKEFSTQWASKPEDKALPRAAVVSERFEVARNFMNKLWNAARFALINLAGEGSGFRVQGSEELELTVEDRWILSRLSTVTQGVTEALENFRYAEAAKTLYDFAWDEFCSFYVEIIKARLSQGGPLAPRVEGYVENLPRDTARRVLAHTLDVLLRLLHPIMPFITEEIWGLLNQVAPRRGIDELVEPTRHIIIAPWPRANPAHQDKQIEARFSTFQAALAALREIRSRQNIAPRQPMEFAIRCDAATAELLRPMAAYFRSMANASATALGETALPPPTHAKAVLANMEIYVDLKDFLDVKAEIAKNEQLEQKLLALIQGKEAKLASESFVQRAPPQVVQSERDSLAQAREQLASVRAALASLRKA